jgi:hypothetical protein
VAARRSGAGKRAAESQEAAAAAVGVVDSAAIGTALGAAERQQPKRQPRSKRGKK